MSNKLNRDYKVELGDIFIHFKNEDKIHEEIVEELVKKLNEKKNNIIKQLKKDERVRSCYDVNGVEHQRP